jgi:type I restriction enzyme M protein
MEMENDGSKTTSHADFGQVQASTIRRVLHPTIHADFCLANQPFNDSDLFRTDDKLRWQLGDLPMAKSNSNLAGVHYYINHFAPWSMDDFSLASRSDPPRPNRGRSKVSIAA